MEHTLSNDSSTSNAPKEVPVLYGPSSLRQLPAKMIQPKLKKSTLKLGKGGAVPGSLRDNEILRPLSRGTPTDDTRLARNLAETPRQRELARQRTQYFNEAFGLREPYHSSQQRVRQVSIVVVEVKTNIQVKFTLISQDLYVVHEAYCF